MEIPLYFDFDRGLAFRHPPQLTGIRDLAERMAASAIRIRATRGAMRLSDGRLIVEAESIARRRSEDIQRLLRGLGIDAPIEAEWSSDPAPADGVDDWMSRGVVVTLVP
jgi:hypothetical protein